MKNIKFLRIVMGIEVISAIFFMMLLIYSQIRAEEGNFIGSWIFFFWLLLLVSHLTTGLISLVKKIALWLRREQ